MGRRGLSSLTGMLVGSVSNKLIHVAKVPVMVALAPQLRTLSRQENGDVFFFDMPTESEHPR